MQNKTWIWVSVGVLIVAVVIWRVVAIMISPDPNYDIDATKDDQSAEVTQPIDATTTVESTPEELRDQVAHVNDGGADLVTGGATPERTPEEELEASLGAFASSFIERIGTYSSSSNFSNLRQAMPLMTARMRARTQSTIAGAAAPTGEAYSVTVRSLSAKRQSGTDASATYLITLQKEINNESGMDRTYQQAEVDLVKDGQDWFADEVRWGEEGEL